MILLGVYLYLDEKKLHVAGLIGMMKKKVYEMARCVCVCVYGRFIVSKNCYHGNQCVYALETNRCILLYQLVDFSP